MNTNAGWCRLLGLLAAFAIAAVVAACGGSSSASSRAGRGATAASGGTGSGLTPITISLYPSTDYAALYVGINKGIFKKYGIDPKITQVTSSTAITAAMTSGKTDIGTNSVASMATAISNGLPLQLVVASDAVPTKGYAGVLVPKNSSIKSWGDLAGKTVATISIQGLFDLGVRNAIQKAGGDPQNMKSIANVPTDAVPALEAGRVQAAVLQDPFLASALASGRFRSLGNPYAQLNYRILSAGFYATKSEIAKKGPLLNKFKTAFEQATKLVQQDPSLARKVIPTYTTLTAKDAATIGLPDYGTDTPPASINNMTAQMKALGWIKSAPSYSDQVWSGS